MAISARIVSELRRRCGNLATIVRFARAVAAAAFAACPLGASAEEGQSFERVVSATPLYFDEKFAGADPDRAVLANGAPGAYDLYLFLASRTGGPGSTLVKKGVMLTMDGQGALRIGARGALQIIVRNGGPIPMFSETVTIVLRDGQPLVSAYSSRMSRLPSPLDADQQRGFESCDLDYLTGRGLRNGKPVAVPPAPKLLDWSQDESSNLCWPG
jgi:hypothetical protein